MRSSVVEDAQCITLVRHLHNINSDVGITKKPRYIKKLKYAYPYFYAKHRTALTFVYKLYLKAMSYKK